MTVLLLFETLHWLSISYRTKSDLLLWPTSLLFTILFYNWCSAIHRFVIPWDIRSFQSYFCWHCSMGWEWPFFAVTLLPCLGSAHSLAIDVDSCQGGFIRSSEWVGYPFSVWLQRPMSLTCHLAHRFTIWVFMPDPPTTMFWRQRVFLIFLYCYCLAHELDSQVRDD